MLDKIRVLNPSENSSRQRTHFKIVDMFPTRTLPRQEIARNPYTKNSIKIGENNKPELSNVKERQTAAIHCEIHSDKGVGVYEGPPELRGVKRSLMSTSEWFVILCQTAIKQVRAVFKTTELTFSRVFFYLC